METQFGPEWSASLRPGTDTELQAAAISAPALRERWYGWRGGGAWASGGSRPEPTSIRVSGIADLADANVLYTSPRMLSRSGLAPGFPALIDAAWRDRGFGDFWSYTLVVEGAADAMVEVDLKPWDAAAPT